MTWTERVSLHPAPAARAGRRPPPRARPRRATSRPPTAAIAALGELLDGADDHDKILLRAAAGAGQVVRAAPHGQGGAGPPRLHARRRHRVRQQAGLPARRRPRQGARRRAGLPVRRRQAPTRGPAGRAGQRHRGELERRRSRRARRSCSASRTSSASGASAPAARAPRAGGQRRAAVRRAVRRRGVAAARCTSSSPSRASRRSSSASATSASSRRSTRARTRGAATPATTRTAPGRPRTSASRRTCSIDLPAVWRPTARAAAAVARVLRRLGPARLRRRPG